MTTRDDLRARRRAFVRFSVLAGSSLALAASWIGVVRADRTVDAVPLAPDVSVSLPASSAEAGLVPAPPATRRMVVVRRSRAS